MWLSILTVECKDGDGCVTVQKCLWSRRVDNIMILYPWNLRIWPHGIWDVQAPTTSRAWSGLEKVSRLCFSCKRLTEQKLQGNGKQKCSRGGFVPSAILVEAWGLIAEASAILVKAPTILVEASAILVKASAFSWRLRPFSWRLRAFSQRLRPFSWNVGHSWRLRAFSRRLWPFSWRLRSFPWRLRPSSWRLRPFSWKLRPFSWRLGPFSWRPRPFSWRLRPFSWKLRPFSWKLRAFSWSIGPFSWRLRPFSWKLRPFSWRLELCALLSRQDTSWSGEASRNVSRSTVSIHLDHDGSSQICRSENLIHVLNVWISYFFRICEGRKSKEGEISDRQTKVFQSRFAVYSVHSLYIVTSPWTSILTKRMWNTSVTYRRGGGGGGGGLEMRSCWLKVSQSPNEWTSAP